MHTDTCAGTHTCEPTHMHTPTDTWQKCHWNFAENYIESVDGCWVIWPFKLLIKQHLFIIGL